MRNGKTPLYIGLSLTFIGIVGMLVTGALVSADLAGESRSPGFQPRQDGRVTTDTVGFTSNGQRIYYTGVGRNGPISVEWDPGYGSGGMMRRQGRRGFARMGCVRCHREDGRGGRLGMMSGGIEAADIRYETLSSPHEDEGERVAGWSDEDIARAVRKGLEPDGEKLNDFMPRWDMGDDDMNDTLDYLKELDEK